MIWGVLLVVVAAGIVALLASRPRRRQHGGASESTVTVRHLVERETGTSNSGHRLRRSITMRGDLADDIADMETRILRLPPEVASADPDEIARNPLVLQRVLAGVRRL